MKRRNNSARLIGKDFRGGWYYLEDINTGHMMRGIIYRVRGGFWRKSVIVNFVTRNVVRGNPDNMPDLIRGVEFGSDYRSSVGNSVAEIIWSGPQSSSPNQPRWRLTMYVPSPRPPWSPRP